MRERIGVRQLDSFQDFTCVDIVLEKCVQVGVRHPQILPFPADSMRTVTDCREFRVHDPGLWIDAVNLAGRRHCKPQFSIAPFLAMRAGAGSGCALHLGHLESTNLRWLSYRDLAR